MSQFEPSLFNLLIVLVFILAKTMLILSVLWVCLMHRKTILEQRRAQALQK